MKPFSVAIVGAGLIGKKRALALPKSGPNAANLSYVIDTSLDRAQALAGEFGAQAGSDLTDVVSKVDVVIVATSNQGLTPVSIQALQACKHVLVEKPAGRNPAELRELVAVSDSATAICRVGFNHRFHPGLQRAKAMMAEKGFGDLMYIRARYGHGARLGYEKEWRGNPAVSGGGELLDQGVHLIDLCRWLGGEFDLDFGRVGTFFWKWPVEDNGFLLLKGRDRKTNAFLHASCTEWKNIFDFEIFGTTAKLQVFGLGRSYGTEELRHFQMTPEMGPPMTSVSQFPGEDLSWNLEWDAFCDEIRGNKTDIATPHDGLRAVEIVYGAYENSGYRF